GGEDGNLRLWKAEEGKPIIDKTGKGQLVKAPGGAVTSLAVADTMLASASTGGQVHLWDLPPGKPARTFKSASPVRALAISADGKLLAAGGDDNAVQLIDP